MNPESVGKNTEEFDREALQTIASKLQPTLIQRYLAAHMGEHWNKKEFVDEKRKWEMEWVLNYAGKTFDLLKSRPDLVELWSQGEQETVYGEIETNFYSDPDMFQQAA